MQARLHQNRWVWLALVGVAVLLGAGPRQDAAPDAAPQVVIELFSRHGCPRCEEAQQFLAELKTRLSGVAVVVHDVGADAGARRRLEALATEKDARAIGVPAFLIRGTLIVGWRDAGTTGRALEAAVSGGQPGEAPGPTCAAPTTACEQEADADTVTLPLVGRLNARRMGLPLFTVVLGMIDGTNPCAMWVLLYLLAILVNLRSRVKMLAIAGTFVLVSGLAYFAFMAAWLNVFQLLGFSRAIQAVLGVVAVGFGALNLKDAVALGRGPSLSIPQRAKPGIYARIRAILAAEHLGPAVAGAAVLAVLVNLVELLCTAGLPAVYTHLLATRQLPGWQRYLYLGLYNVAYMLDDMVMLAIAIVTLSRRKLQERGGRILKVVSGGVMLALGMIMLLRPQWLR